MANRSGVGSFHMSILLSLSVQAKGADDLEILAVDDGDVVAQVVVKGHAVAAI